MNKKNVWVCHRLCIVIQGILYYIFNDISVKVCHAIAIELEKSKEDCDVELTDITQDKSRQTRIDKLALSSSRETYTRMLITAYEIAVHSNVSLSTFSIFIKVQHQNGVKFISGK